MNRGQPAPPELDGFEYLQMLGSGGFADVFLYQQLRLRRKVAIKVLTRGLGEQGQRAFEAEANLMAQLSNHPSIVSIYQAGVVSGRPYLVLEYCPPPALDRQARSRPLSLARTLEIGIQIGGAVETAHRLGILHRDIKPANILFTEFGRPALTDFGISVSTRVGESTQGTGVSVPWAPPEQLIAGQPMGPGGDVYSLAATIWTMLCGRSPFALDGAGPDGNSEGSVLELTRRIRTAAVPATGREDVPEELERILRTAMAKEPAARYPSALELARALQSVQTQLHLSVTPIDVRDESAGADDASADSGSTRISGFAVIDPQGTNDPTAQSRPRVLQHGRGNARVQVHDFTGPAVPRQPEPAADPDTQQRLPEPATARTVSVRALLLAGAGVLAALAGIGGLLLANSGHASTATASSSSSAQPQDAIGPQPPPAPTGTAVLRDGKVQVSWNHPSAQAGDTFIYKVDDPANPQEYQSTSETRAVVPAVPGQTCVKVQLRRSSGQTSSATAPDICTKANQ